ncbi:AMP-binding protein [Streptomyces sp. NPDC051677]|uniref:AMP-binding protein n=1 Tax=Streptomyces sp. NPDC051677 TaxID=3365669 RepID=UPI0037D974D4
MSFNRVIRGAVDPAQAQKYKALGWWRDRTVVDDLLDHATAQPLKTAVISHHHDREPDTLTYAELAEWVDRFAGALLELGVRRGEVVSMQLPNWWQFVALHLACGRIGAVTNAILPILRRREVSFICDRLRSRVLIVPRSFRGFDHAAMAAEVSAGLDTLEHVLAIDADGVGLPTGVRDFDRHFVHADWRGRHRETLAGPGPEPDTVAQVQFTSGTTGEPKGVVHTWNTVYAGMRPSVEAVGLTSDDVVLAFSPLAHTVGFYYGITMPVSYGMTVVLQDLWDPRVALGLVRRHAVTWTMAATPFIKDLCDAAEPEAAAMTLRRISCAGAPIPPSLVHQVQDILNATLFSVWGMTEVGAVTSTLSSDDPLRAAETDGAAMAWNELAVLGPDGAEVPKGSVGRLGVRGASLLVGYHGRPDLFEAAFDAQGWFDTGDLARMDDAGYIRIAGRAKDIVVRGGENIPVVEVEAELVRHPGVRDVALVGVPDERLGERATAVVVPTDPAAPPNLGDLTGFLEEQGMAKHFWPEFLTVVPELPRTATGKIQKFRVRELAVDHKPAPDAPSTSIGEETP